MHHNCVYKYSSTCAILAPSERVIRAHAVRVEKTCQILGKVETPGTQRTGCGVPLQKKHTFLSRDITNTTAPSHSFDVAVLTEVLEHLPEPLLAIQELVRVVKSGGHILVTAPFTSGSHQQPFHFSAGYSREWYTYAAEKFSLKVVEMASQGNFFQLMAQESRRVSYCGRQPAHQSSPLLASIHQAFYDYALLKSEHNDAHTATCYDQFTIGWMVHFKKLG